MKRKIKLEYALLFLLFLFVLGFRLYFAFQTSQFNTDNAYFHFRHIDSLVKENKILFYDDLSYGGRFILYPPLFHIIMALLSFGSIFMLKFIPEFFISLTVFVVYIIAKEISGSSYAALFSALLSSFYPILFIETLNNISVYSLVIPLLLIMLYSLLKLDEKVYLWVFIVSSFLLPLIHPSAFIFVVTVVIYFILLAGGALTPTKLKKEAVLFSMLLIILFEFIIYKKAFLQYGANVLWQNIPSNILIDKFRDLSVLDLLFGVGLLPLVLGSIGIYIGIVKEKIKIAYMFASFAITVLLLLVFRFLTISVGLMYFGIVLSIFSAYSVVAIYKYLDKLKFSHLKTIFVSLLLVLFLVSSFSPSFFAAKNSNDIAINKVKQVKWFSINTAPGSVILGDTEEGNLIAAIGNRTNVIDSNFLLAPDPLVRTRDVDTIYTTASEAVAMSLIKKYNINVIYLSYDTRELYNITKLRYAEGSKCFESLRENRYYVVKC